MIARKRVYEPKAKSDGYRVLVERLWPRGFTKERADIDRWLKDVAPSPKLREWFSHDPDKWSEFRRRYLAELKEEPAASAVQELLDKVKQGTVTLVYSSREGEHNSAAVLQEYLERRLAHRRAA